MLLSGYIFLPSIAAAIAAVGLVLCLLMLGLWHRLQAAVHNNCHVVANVGEPTVCVVLYRHSCTDVTEVYIHLHHVQLLSID